jgi:hypothetical protein
MTTPAPDPDTQARMHEIAAGLAAGGLACEVHDTRGVLDVTASFGPPGGRPVEVIVDDDLYVEVRYWNPPGATPDHVVAVITTALAAVIKAVTTPG